MIRALWGRRAWLCPHSKMGRQDSVGKLSAGHCHTKQPRELVLGPSHCKDGSKARGRRPVSTRSPQVFRKLRRSSSKVSTALCVQRGLLSTVAWGSGCLGYHLGFQVQGLSSFFHYYWMNFVPSSLCVFPSPLMESLRAEVTLFNSSTKESVLLPNPFLEVPTYFF